MAPRYNKNHYVLELHIDNDVLSHDYGSNEGSYVRALERIVRRMGNNEYTIRVWHEGRLFHSEDHYKTVTE